jgi:hypothetical protein
MKQGNACYHSVQNRFPSSLLSKRIHLEATVYRAVIFLVGLCSCDALYLNLRGEYRLKYF